MLAGAWRRGLSPPSITNERPTDGPAAASIPDRSPRSPAAPTIPPPYGAVPKDVAVPAAGPAYRPAGLRAGSLHPSRVAAALLRWLPHSNAGFGPVLVGFSRCSVHVDDRVERESRTPMGGGRGWVGHRPLVLPLVLGVSGVPTRNVFL